MDSISDILANKDFSQPDEVTAIKAYVAAKYNQNVTVSINNREITLSSQSAALIATLRMNTPELIKAAGTTRRIRFRIG